MSDNEIFKIFIPEKIEFFNGSTFENFMGQFQKYSTSILCIIDGALLKIFNTHDHIPKNIRFDYKLNKEYVIEYYFRDIEDNTLYCVFGRDAAKIFFPHLDRVDPHIVSNRNNTNNFSKNSNGSNNNGSNNSNNNNARNNNNRNNSNNRNNNSNNTNEHRIAIKDNLVAPSTTPHHIPSKNIPMDVQQSQPSHSQILQQSQLPHQSKQPLQTHLSKQPPQIQQPKPTQQIHPPQPYLTKHTHQKSQMSTPVPHSSRYIYKRNNNHIPRMVTIVDEHQTHKFPDINYKINISLDRV